MDAALKRKASVLGISERLIQAVAESGLRTEATPFIRAAQQAAGQLASLLEGALRSGAIATVDLFDEHDEPSRSRNPAQVSTRFTLNTHSAKNRLRPVFC